MKYVRVVPFRMWKYMISRNYPSSRIGIFRNLPHIRPGRWGIYFFGLEIGSRNPGDKLGIWLKNKGLYPW